jgi:diaminohydroxyphosphoribosylaminopyrimidine deaminase/5-amino-6-(5-phosphoribosylamino)uracil reductase
MGTEPAELSALDRLYLQRAYELASRAVGNTAPNPPVGAVLVAGGEVVGEGYHHRSGEPHAEANALAQAGERARGATAYVSLEPCAHVGRTPACAPALIVAGIRRVVVGAPDPNPVTGGRGIARLRENGIEVTIADDERAHELIEIFAGTVASDRAFVTVKLAMSLDGAIASRPGIRQWLTGEQTRSIVRDLRVAHDAVMVGAGTVRVDDPRLTVRPAHHRLKPYVRVVACETDAVPQNRQIFEPAEGYAKTIVLAPGGLRARFQALQSVADVLFVGEGERLDLAVALRLLREREIFSVLCEGGPTLAGRLIAQRLADRFHWAIAPLLLQGPGAVAVLAGADLAAAGVTLRFERVRRAGDDLVASGRFCWNGETCLAD